MQTTELSCADAINNALDLALEKSDDVILMGAGVDDPAAIFQTTKNLVKKYGKNRVMDMPLSENGFTGIANGAALCGMRPVLIHQRLDFLPMCMDQLVNQAAKLHYMTGGKVNVPMVIRTQGGPGTGDAAQHSQCLEAFFMHVPGLKVVMPSTPYDVKGL